MQRKATMIGGSKTQYIGFNYAGAAVKDHHGNGASAELMASQGDYIWRVEAISGHARDYAHAMEQIMDELDVLGVCVPELEPVNGCSDCSNARPLALGTIAMLLLMVFALLAVMLPLHGCDSTGSKQEPAALNHRWLGYPLEAHISLGLDDCKQASALAAIAWAERRIGTPRFNITLVPQDSMSISGIPDYKVVEFSAEPPMVPVKEQLGATEIYELKGRPRENGIRWAHSAQIRTHTCDVSTWIHETFHALGLGHGTGTLMDVRHGLDQYGRGGDTANMLLLPQELEVLRI